MRENVGSIDAFARTVVGGALAYVAVRELGPRKLRSAALLALGALLVESAITRVCPLHHLLGLDTRNWRPRRLVALRVRGESAWATLQQRDEVLNAADLELPYEDMGSLLRPPSDS